MKKDPEGGFGGAEPPQDGTSSSFRLEVAPSEDKISNQMHSCRPACSKYDPVPFYQTRRQCRFNYPALWLHEPPTKKPFAMGLEYVAVSRVKKMEDTILTHPIRDAPLTTTEAPPSSEPVD